MSIKPTPASQCDRLRQESLAFQSAGSHLQAIPFFRRTAICYEKSGDLRLAAECYLGAAKSRELIHDHAWLSLDYLAAASCYERLADNQQTVRYYELALQSASRQRQVDEILSSLVGLTSFQFENYGTESALPALDKLLHIMRNEGVGSDNVAWKVAQSLEGIMKGVEDDQYSSVSACRVSLEHMLQQHFKIRSLSSLNPKGQPILPFLLKLTQFMTDEAMLRPKIKRIDVIGQTTIGSTISFSVSVTTPVKNDSVKVAVKFDPALTILGENPVVASKKDNLWQTQWQVACDQSGLHRVSLEISSYPMYATKPTIFTDCASFEVFPPKPTLNALDVVGIETAVLSIVKVEDNLVLTLSESPNSPMLLRDARKADSTTINRLIESLNEISDLSGGRFSRSQLMAPVSHDNSLPSLQKVAILIRKLLLTEKIWNSLLSMKTDFLTVSIDEDLAAIPWEIAGDDEQFLCTRFAIGRRTATGHLPSHLRLKSTQLRALLIGDPKEDLPSAAREVSAVYSKLRNIPQVEVEEPLLGGRASVLAVEEALNEGSYDIIHYAGHAEFNKADPSKSAIVLKDGKIRGFEIAKLCSSNPPSIVFCNACESAQSDTWKEPLYEGDVSGLSNAFLSAGVGAYVGPLWPIPDEEAGIIASSFYSSVLNGIPIGIALRNARNECREKSRADISWAGLLLFGNPATKLIG